LLRRKSVKRETSFDEKPVLFRAERRVTHVILKRNRALRVNRYLPLDSEGSLLKSEKTGKLPLSSKKGKKNLSRKDNSNFQKNEDQTRGKIRGKEEGAYLFP